MLIGSYRDEGKAELCREKGCFYYHAIRENGDPVNIEARHLHAEFFVPYVGSHGLGWYAPVSGVKLVSREKLAATLGVDAATFFGSQCPYYFMLSFSNPVDGLPPTTASPVRGRPRTLAWAELWK